MRKFTLILLPFTIIALLFIDSNNKSIDENKKQKGESPDMLYTIYAILCIVLPCVVYQLITIRQKDDKEKLLSHLILVYIFLIYIHLVFSVTGFGSVWDIGQYNTVIRLEEINLGLFQSEGIMVYALNILMLVPLGFLLPLIWEEYRTPVKVFLTGFSLSLTIELSQLFNRRNTDVNDLLMNTLGAILGYLIWLLFKNTFKRTNNKTTALSQHEPIIYLVLAAAGRFLLYNWRLLV